MSVTDQYSVTLNAAMALQPRHSQGFALQSFSISPAYGGALVQGCGSRSGYSVLPAAAGTGNALESTVKRAV
jgi:hypothetical protein